MSQEQDSGNVIIVEQTDVKNNPAFEIDSINLSTGEVVIVIQKGVLGALANQLKNTSNRRKASSILRKLGYMLSDCGDVLYGAPIDKTDLNPDLVIGPVEK